MSRWGNRWAVNGRSLGQSFLGCNCWWVTRWQAGPQSSPTSWMTSAAAYVVQLVLVHSVMLHEVWLYGLDSCPEYFYSCHSYERPNDWGNLSDSLHPNMPQENTSEKKLDCRYLELYNQSYSLIQQFLSGTAN